MMYQGHQAPYLQTVTGFLHHSPLPALPPSHLPPSNAHQHFQNNTSGDASESDAASAAVSTSAASILLFESRQTNRELRLQLTDTQLKLDRLLAKVDEIGSERSSAVVLRNSSSSVFEPKSSYFQLTKASVPHIQIVSQRSLPQENEELKSRMSELTIKLQSHQDNISSLLDSNQKLLEQNVDLMGRSFDSLGNQSNQTTSHEAMMLTNSLNSAASEERDTLRVELASMRIRETECQRQIEKLIKIDQENKLHLQQTDLQLKDWSQTMDRLNAELSEERRRRKEAEMTSRALATDAEETKTKNAALQKALSDLKTSSKSKIMELEHDVKSLQDNHQKELSMVKERFRKDKSRVQDDHSEMLRQTEESLKSSLKRKYENMEKTLKDRHSLQLDELSSERSFLVDRVSSMEQKIAELKSQRTAEESTRTALLSEVEEHKAWKAKYDNLRKQAISMKDRYTQQMDGLKEESSLLEEKCSRMTDKYYKAEESLSDATQKYEEFKVRSLESRMEFEAKLHQLEAELVGSRSELDKALRREVQIRLKLDEALNEQRRLAETLEALEKERERELGHVAQTTVVPLTRTKSTNTQGDFFPLCSHNEDAKEVSMTPLGGVSNGFKYELVMEKRAHEQEKEEQPEMREPEEEDDDDDADSFVTAFGDNDAVWLINEEMEDVTCFNESLQRDSRVFRPYSLQSEKVIDGYIDLRNDARTTSAIDLDIARFCIHEKDSGANINTGDRKEEKRESQTKKFEIECGSYLANDLGVHFDLNLEKDLGRTEVTYKRHDSELTLPSKTTDTSRDLKSNSESLVSNLHPPTGASDLQSGVDLEASRELDLGVVRVGISEQRAVEDLQRQTEVPSHATEAMLSAPTLNRSFISEPSSHESPVTTEASSTGLNGGLEVHVNIPVKSENAKDVDFLGQSKAERDLQKPSCPPSSRGDICDGETFAVDIDHKANDMTDEKLGDVEDEDRSEIQSTSSAVRENESGDKETCIEDREQRKHDRKSVRLDSIEDKERISQPGIEAKGDLPISGEVSSLLISEGSWLDHQEADDPTYTVTSGGKIIPGTVATEGDEEGFAAGGGWLADAEGDEDAWIHTRVDTSVNYQHPAPLKNDSSDRQDFERALLDELDETNVESKEQTDGSPEDLVYTTVTSGGQIVPGWTNAENPMPDGASRTIPEVDQQRLTAGGTTGFEVTEVLEGSSSASGISDAPDAGFSQPERGSGTLEVVETGSETPLRKPEDPVSRFGACVILREEDIEKMRERRMNDSLEEKKKETTTKRKKKKTGR